MEMTIKIKLSSGKEIELSASEYDELKGSFENTEYVPIYPPYPDPILQPYITWNTPAQPDVNCPSVWCEPHTGTDYIVTTTNRCIYED